jgi:hypothetical protein
MIRMTHARLLAGAAAAMALSGCLGGGGGGSGGGGGGGTPSPSDYATRLDEVQGRIPTSDLPTSGSGRFTGATRLDVYESGSSTVIGEVIGALEMTVDFDPAVTDPIQGTATDFAGTVGGQDVAWSGTLANDPRFPTAVARTTTDVPLPGGGSTTVNAGSMSVSLTGDIETPEGTTELMLQLGGFFVGPGATGAHGPALALGWDGGGFADNVGAGDFYIDRD